MSLEDPLEEYRVAAADQWTTGDVETLAGELLLERWPDGGNFVAISRHKVWLEHDDELLGVPWKDIEGVWVTRNSRIKPMRWGIVLYLISIPLVFLNPLVAMLPLLAGGVLVVKGFLSKSLVVQLEDDRVPPLLIPQSKWKKIGRAIEKRRT